MTPVGASLIFAVLMLAFVAWMVGWALRTDRRAKSETTWATVTGLVSRSEVASGKTLKAKIVYSYSFNGQEYVGKVIQSNMVSYSGARSPRRLCDRFPVGSRPTVYVDSGRPKRAVLIPGGDRMFLYFVLGLAGFFVLTSGFMVVMSVVGS